ncbi:solute carrier family 52, riboflavin transporter, member 3-B isoform X2 [Palaemon carinicauda]
MTRRNPLVDVLAAVFGIGAWVSVNGLWVELPLLVEELPEKWNLPSFLTVIISIANVGPIAYSLWRLYKPRQRPAPVVYGLLSLGCIASLLLSLLWDHTSVIGDKEHSTALLVLVFMLSLVDCTSSVLFIPYMAIWRNTYLPSYFVGEGLSGLLPALVALTQGAGGDAHCVNQTFGNETHLVPAPLEPNFSVQAFFLILFAMMVASATAFTMLEFLPSIKGERASSPTESETEIEVSQSKSHLMIEAPSKRIMRTMSYRLYATMLLGQIWACSLTNGILPSIQSYSCGPYGNVTYHLAATLSAVANPVAALATLMLPRAKSWVLAVLGTLGTIVGGYLMATALLSPSPPLVDETGGKALVILSWVLFTALMTYVRVEIANLMREEGAHALFWCGAVTQIGSAGGAVIGFLLVNVFHLFAYYDPCS